MTDYIAHFIIGLLGLGAGFVGAKFCPHPRHQFAVGLIIVFFETMLTVPLVG